MEDLIIIYNNNILALSLSYLNNILYIIIGNDISYKNLLSKIGHFI